MAIYGTGRSIWAENICVHIVWVDGLVFMDLRTAGTNIRITYSVIYAKLGKADLVLIIYCNILLGRLKMSY